jgi:aryl-alcohol dehydrogenase-like predicted oxidoreductase
MKYRKLGSSGVKVSALCLGAMTFGDANEDSFMHKVGCDEATSHRLMSRALEGGINFIDVADVYGQDGLSERVVGNWFEKTNKRDQIVLATKFRFRMSEGPNGTGASRRRIVTACDASLRRLKTDRIDLYQIHMQDLDTPEEETLRALDDLIHQGKVLYIGASNYAAYRLVESLFTSAREHLHRFVTLQAQYSLIVRELEREHVPACRKFGLGILPWAPLAAGFLSGKYGRGQPGPKEGRLSEWSDRYRSYDNDRSWRVLDVLTALSKETGSTLSQLALAWLLAKPSVTAPIVGVRRIEQLEDNLKAADLELSPDQVAKLDAASAFDIGYPYEMMQRVQGGW